MSPSSPAGGPPLRAVAMVLIAFAIMFGGLGAFSLSGSSSDDGDGSSTTSGASAPQSSMPRTSGPTGSATAGSTEGRATTTPKTTTTKQTGPVDKTVPVRVLNNSLIHGLAGKVAGQLQSAGWTNVSTGNYGASTLPSTTVYYGDAPGEKAAAESVAATLGAATQAKFAGISGMGPGVIVIATSG